MIVEVFLSLAMICFNGDCYPALVGNKTQIGTYQLTHSLITANGYGGDVLAYDWIDDDTVNAIHRVWTLNPKQKRRERLLSDDPSQRRFITGGCINVDPIVYDSIVSCCSEATLIIKE